MATLHDVLAVATCVLLACGMTRQVADETQDNFDAVTSGPTITGATDIYGLMPMPNGYTLARCHLVVCENMCNSTGCFLVGCRRCDK